MGTGRLYDVWVTNYSIGGISKISNDVSTGYCKTNPDAYGICIDRNNVVWTTSDCGILYKIINNNVSKTFNFGAGLRGICIDKNNAIWVADSGNLYKIVNDVVVKTISGFDNIYDICVDKNNAILVTNNDSFGRISKIVNDTVVKTINVGNFPQNICVDKNNVIWVANVGNNTNSPGTVSKIVNDTVVKTITVGSNPQGICVDKNNAIWVANSNSATVSKIVNDVVEKTFNINSPLGICIDKNNAIWVANYASNTITKIVNDSIVNTITSYNCPWKITTGMEYELLFGSKHLIQDGTIIKTFNGTSFTTIGSAPVTDTMFETNGFSDFSGLTKDKLVSLTSPRILTKKTDSISTNIKATGTPLPKLVLANSDILLSGTVSSLDKFTLTATNSGTGIMKIITSFDSGTTWKAYNTSTSTWITVDKNTLSDVKSKGNTVAELNAITSGVWYDAILNANKKVRFGYYLEANDITDSVFTDLLTMQLDMNGSWKLCKLNTDYTYTYENSNGLKINLLNNGDYRVSVIS